MSDAQKSHPDPFKLWRQIYDASESAWSSALEKAMTAPAFAEANGKLMETLLTAQRSARENMRTFLEGLNVPTREDIARLGEVMIGMEEKIDQIVDRLDAIEERIARVTKGPAAGQTKTTSPTEEA